MTTNFHSFRHREFSSEVVVFGEERQSLVIIDNFLTNVETLIDYAEKSGQVVMASGMYPGLRSPSPELYKKVVIHLLTDIICQIFDLKPTDIAGIDSSFSMVATPRAKLSPYQRIPHFDRPRPNEIALLHFLCDARHGGTSFYRHRTTGYEFIDEDRVGRYNQVIADEIAQVGLPDPPSFINGDTEIFKRVLSVPARFNRCLIYRCSNLHSGDIAADYAYDMNPWSGRFTITSFLHR